MPKLEALNDLTTLGSAVPTINDNFDKITTALNNTLSRDGSTPNSMSADLDMNSNDILNVNKISVQTFEIDGLNLEDYTNRVEEAAARVSIDTRAELVTYIASNEVVTGRTYIAGGRAYAGLVGSTAIADLPDLIPIWGVTPEHFGATGSASEDARVAIQAAIDFIHSQGGGELILSDGKVYAVSQSDLAHPINASRQLGVLLKPGVILSGRGTLQRFGTDTTFDLVVGAGTGSFPDVTETMGVAGGITLDGNARARTDGLAGNPGNGDGFNLWLYNVRDPYARDFKSVDAASWGVRIERCRGGRNIGNIGTDHGAEVNADGVHFIDCWDMASHGFNIYTEGDDGFIVEAKDFDIRNLNFTGVTVEAPLGVTAAGRGVLVFRETLGGTLTTPLAMENIRIEAVTKNCGVNSGSGLSVDATAALMTGCVFEVQVDGCTRGMTVLAGTSSIAGSITGCVFRITDNDSQREGSFVIRGSAVGSVIDGNYLEFIQRNPVDARNGLALGGDRWTGSFSCDYDPNGTKVSPADPLVINGTDNILIVSVRGGNRNVSLGASSDRNTVIAGALLSPVSGTSIINGGGTSNRVTGENIEGTVAGLPTGFYGIGTVRAPLITDWDALDRRSGSYGTDSSSTSGTPPNAYSGFSLTGILEERHYDNGSKTQLWVSIGAEQVWFRRYTASAWGTWRCLANGQSVTSATDTTAGRVLTVGYQGLGGQMGDIDPGATGLVTRFARANSGTRPTGENFHMVHLSRALDANGAQIMVREGPSSERARMFFRHRDGTGTWSSYVETSPILSGTTANRPTAQLVTGLCYFDTTLGRPIWRSAVGTWVDATGATV